MAESGEILYIGRSQNMRHRWISHHRHSQVAEFDGAKIAWIEISDCSLLPEIEFALIEYFRPPLNRSPGLAPLPESDTSGYQVAALRKRRNLTQRQVAEVLGVTDQAISNWERGRVDFRMTATQWVKLLQLLDCT
ncbi:MAG TPA: helix-turn-helix domain-containing protein, partial [Allocoleopsis sp.]